MGKPTPHTLCRIGYLTNPKMVDVLLDEFQSDGMPMGSDQWADYCILRIRELKAKEDTLRRIVQAQTEMAHAVEYCTSDIFREKRNELTRNFQNRQSEAKDG